MGGPSRSGCDRPGPSVRANAAPGFLGLGHSHSLVDRQPGSDAEAEEFPFSWDLGMGVASMPRSDTLLLKGLTFPPQQAWGGHHVTAPGTRVFWDSFGAGWLASLFLHVFWAEGGMGAVITIEGSGLAQQSVVPLPARYGTNSWKN